MRKIKREEEREEILRAQEIVSKVFYAKNKKFPFLTESFLISIKIPILISMYISNIIEKKPMSEDHIGYIHKIDNKFIIGLNEDNCSVLYYPQGHNEEFEKYTPVEKWKNFFLARMLSHYLYDQDYLNTYKKIDYFLKSPKNSHIRYMQVKSYMFASELLMPDNLFIELWETRLNLEQISDFFCVPKNFVISRVAYLLGETY